MAFFISLLEMSGDTWHSAMDTSRSLRMLSKYFINFILKMEGTIQEAFSIFADDERKDLIRSDQIIPLLRSVGYIVHEEDLGELLKQESLYLSLEDVEELLKCGKIPMVSEEEALEAFEVFDKGKTGEISISLLKHIVQQGESFFAQEELDAALEILNPNPEGVINYRKIFSLPQTQTDH
ncbi:hypothetical protein NECID01_1576 [Nematocida sp. AWRm77]|nr:hypothetical protein NECID01_1576 [Nematocida sp. AWRm77]